MLTVKAQTSDTLTLTDLKTFQGDLKKRSATDIDALIASIKEDGLLMPIAVWKHDDVNNILDGHARLEALIKLAIDDPTILEMHLPVVYIDAETDEEARKTLLQITSSYGRVTKKGLTAFTVPITNYAVKAPVVLKVLDKPVQARTSPVMSDDVILKLRVNKNMVRRLTEVLSGVDGVSIL